MDDTQPTNTTKYSAITGTWTKQNFTGRKKVQGNTHQIDNIIIENYQNELQWDQEQALIWIENVLDKQIAGNGQTLAQVLQDGTVLCQLLQAVAPETCSRMKYHTAPTTVSQKIENITSIRLRTQK